MNETIYQREPIEWTNTWINQGNHPEKPRILLIGDSVARQIRPSIQRRNRLNYCVDFFGSSLPIWDEYLERELDCFFSDGVYTYDYILFNYGFHHALSSQNNNEELFFYHLMEKFICKLRLVTPNISILSGTYHTDSVSNNIISKRNSAASRFAQNQGYIYIDISEYWRKNSERFLYVDHVHFDRTADDFFSDYILHHIGLDNYYSKENLCTLITSTEHLLRHCNLPTPVIIYGNGEIGQFLYLFLKYHQITPLCFCVSDGIPHNNMFSAREIPILELSQIAKNYNETILIKTFVADVDSTISALGLHYYELSSNVIETIKKEMLTQFLLS